MIDQLHNGSNMSDTLGNEDVTEDIKTEALQEEQQRVLDLMPQVEQIVDICNQEIAAVSDIRAYIKELGTKPRWNEIQAEYRARELYIQFLNNLKSGTLNRVATIQEDLA